MLGNICTQLTKKNEIPPGMSVGAAGLHCCFLQMMWRLRASSGHDLQLSVEWCAAEDEVAGMRTSASKSEAS